ncbi:hypothetical protein C7974DRAFT_376455 [Boeremia exigua]|uniref:uncharacterized protein n=1 Tax=Boeremia exigua TaxID=749465 RepID=UPI001E8D741D|nr:uncharacterized protein C7974DRAFT_376455 [Boeremia exigua]KAH6629640.1 hypothetical protein C7974DRAFT_376455 [Boeremia exigua]
MASADITPRAGFRIPGEPTAPSPKTSPSLIRSFVSRLQQKHRAPKNARLNQKHCVFYQLPAELHMCIASHLSGADLLSYAQCSRKTPFLTFQLQPPRSVKADFAARLRRDRDLQMLSLRGDDTQKFAWCSDHLVLHHVGLFAPSQLLDSVSNDTRVCVCARARFRVCEHRSCSLKELVSVPSDILSQLCDKHADAEEGIIGPCLTVTLRGLSVPGRMKAMLTVSHIICRIPYYEAIETTVARMHLVQLKVHICPHLTTADEAVLSKLCAARKKVYCNDWLFADVREGFSVKENCEYCAAEYTLHRRDGGGSVLLDVRRKVRDLNSKDVLVHLEDCGDVHCVHDGTLRCSEYCSGS